MPVSNLGRIGFVTKGNWSAGAYKYLDVVKHAAGTWICAVPTTTEEPSTGADWQNALSLPSVIGLSNWSELSGEKSPPLIVYDDQKYWSLTATVSNIALNKPANSPAFFKDINYSYIEEAPIDDKTYGRKNAGWVEVESGFDYSQPLNPTTNINPATTGVSWVNTVSGEIFICTDATVGKNLWVGQLGTAVAPPSNDGSTLDGLTFNAMTAAGNYDPTTDTGFFGEVPASVLFTGPQIASAIGLTAGTSQHDNEPWLKFFVGANADCNRNNGVPYVLYIAKKPYRHTVSWDAIHARGAVYWGEGATVDKGGITLDVGLMFGAYADPANSDNVAPLSTTESCAANHGQGSHWNDLIYRVMSETPSCPSSDTYHGGPQVGGNWASYQNSDLAIASGDGRLTWCQETSALTGTYRVRRGNERLSLLTWFTSSNASSIFGFRPALRLS